MNKCKCSYHPHEVTCSYCESGALISSYISYFDFQYSTPSLFMDIKGAPSHPYYCCSDRYVILVWIQHHSKCTSQTWLFYFCVWCWIRNSKL